MSTKRNKEKKFIQKPQYPGGSEAMRKAISKNLSYPKEAIEKQIEGTVYLSYIVNNQGEIEDIRVTKGIGYGCDEEAMRLIGLLKYEAPRNRGIKVRSTMKTRITFRLPQAPVPVYNYLLTQNKGKQKPAVKTAGSNVYGYTLTFNDPVEN